MVVRICPIRSCTLLYSREKMLAVAHGGRLQQILQLLPEFRRHCGPMCPHLQISSSCTKPVQHGPSVRKPSGCSTTAEIHESRASLGQENQLGWASARFGSMSSARDTEFSALSLKQFRTKGQSLRNKKRPEKRCCLTILSFQHCRPDTGQGPVKDGPDQGLIRSLQLHETGCFSESDTVLLEKPIHLDPHRPPLVASVPIGSQ